MSGSMGFYSSLCEFFALVSRLMDPRDRQEAMMGSRYTGDPKGFNDLSEDIQSVCN